MTKTTLLLRLPTILSVLIALTAFVPAEGINILHAKGRTHSTVENAAGHTAAKKKPKKRRRSRRKYTRRGNPEVTRKVATTLIIEKLPGLAQLVNLPVPSESTAVGIDSITLNGQNPESGSLNKATSHADAVAIPVSTTLTTSIASSVQDSYTDAELDEREDPDAISADDEANLADEENLEINDFYKEFTNYMASLNGEQYVTYNGIDKVVVMETLMEWLGTRYLFGGITSSGIDCSAFTRMMYRTIGYALPRTAATQWGVGNTVEREELQFGDLVFFNTRRAVYVSHVGMYLGNGMFAHASSRNGVTVSSLNSDYYNAKFIGARRYNVNSVATATTGVDVQLN